MSSQSMDAVRLASTRPRGASVFEVWVLAGLLSGHAASGIVDEHLFEEVESILIEVRAEGNILVANPFRE